MKRDAIYEYAVMREGVECWLRQFDTRDRPCAGSLERAHLLPKQLLKREGHPELIPDPRTWRPACRLHHFSFDAYMGVVVPRNALPDDLERLCEQIELAHWLDRRYGEKGRVAA